MTKVQRSPKKLINTPEQQAIWDVIEQRIEQAPCDGISAEGVYSASVHSDQKIFIKGMRTARLAAINVLNK